MQQLSSMHPDTPAMLTLKETPQTDRPRERLLANGVTALSDTELLALLLGSGVRGRDVLTVARELLATIDTHWSTLDAEVLGKIAGVGPARAAVLLAAFEFTRRRIRPAGLKIREPHDVLPLVQHLADRQQEHFICISLNGAHEVIATRIVTIGLANSTLVHPREVFSDPLGDRACAIIVAHNHPSGNLTPSEEDRRVTRTLVDSGKILGISVLDHLIFSRTNSYSFAMQGEMPR